MTVSKTITASLAAFLIAALTGQAVLAADNEKFDVAGFTLGMTPEQALQALREYGADDASISETQSSYSYSDGLNHDYRTEAFVSRISAAKTRRFENGREHTDSVNLYFSPPPEGGRLVGLERLVRNRIDPVTNGEFRDAIIDKYGEPTAANASASMVNWKFGGGDKNCLSTGLDGVGVQLPDVRKNKNILDVVYRRTGGSYRLDLFRVSAVKNLEECANMLEFRLGSNGSRPADDVSTLMIDVQSWVRAELAAGEELEKLRQAAIEKRQGKGKKPAL